MKNYYYLPLAALIALSSCGASKQSAQSATTDSATSTVQTDSNIMLIRLVAKMHIPATIKTGDSILLKFTVSNLGDSSLRFCKWHTPFEPLMSKYLNVKNEKGEEMAYLGAMAKRIMPPPESSYITIASKDSLTVTVDLLKAYFIEQPGKYSITYIGGNMSGLQVSNDVTFKYVK